MDFFFQPRGVAVIGASSNPLKGGYSILKNLISGFPGKVYPVNPSYKEIEGIICYPDILSVPAPLDLAIVFVPAKAVPDLVSACAERGIKGVIIESGGFAESGEAGKALQDRLLSIMEKTGIRLWGPNCMGLVDFIHGHIFSFVSPTIWEQEFLPSDVSLIVQSGMLSAGFLMDLMSHNTMGVCKACSIGNRIDVDECDVLEYLIDDPHTGTIGLYVESITNGPRFLSLINSTEKPVVVLKGGKSEKGAKAAMSHTASLAGNNNVFQGALAQANVIEAKDFKQMMDILKTVSAFKHLPSIPGKKVIVLTYSGAAGILSSDFIDEVGLELSDLEGETKALMQSVFPDWMPVSNPVDMWPAIEKNGRKKVYGTAFMAAATDPCSHAILFHAFISPGAKLPDPKTFRDLAEHARKPIVCWSMGNREDVAAFNTNLQKAGIPVYGELYRAVECLAHLMDWKSRYPRHKSPLPLTSLPEPIVSLPPSTGSRTVLDEISSKQILQAYDIPIVKELPVSSEDDACDSATELGFPVVLKGISPQAIHKTEQGVVHIDLHTDHHVRQAYKKVKANLLGDGRVIVQQHIKGEFELIAGFVRDPQFGPCIMVGMGGIMAEIMKDTIFATAPLSHDDARGMLSRLKAARLLDGFRGAPPLDKEAMTDILVRLARLGVSHPQIKEIDINPLIIREGYPIAVDASIILGD